ncbi:hypothetical protein MPC1_9750002 [Methylocella tundrae]|nr:hypothetical protein MPC1_9750002 [Methylocella tundrae]
MTTSASRHGDPAPALHLKQPARLVQHVHKDFVARDNAHAMQWNINHKSAPRIEQMFASNISYARRSRSMTPHRDFQFSA